MKQALLAETPLAAGARDRRRGGATEVSLTGTIDLDGRPPDTFDIVKRP